VEQTIHDCLHDAMDVEGLERLLRAMEAGEIATVHRDLTEPSPLALQILTARPYAFLDDAPLEERRTQAVMSRRWLDEESAAGLGRPDAPADPRVGGAAVAGVRSEAWPSPVNADELHDSLLALSFVTEAEAAERDEWKLFLADLAGQKRATRIAIAGEGRPALWVAAERLPQFEAVFE